MISEYYEKLIIEDKARNNVFNVSTAVSNLVVGRARHLIINSIHVHPLIKTYVIELPETSGTTIDEAIQSLFDESAVFTISFTSNNDNYNVSFKNRLSVNTSAYQKGAERGTLITATSILDFKEDVFFKFTGENINIEVSEIRALMNGAGTTTGAAEYTKNGNPSGFDNPIILKNLGTNFITNPGGDQTNPTTGVYNFYDLTIPKIGNGLTGNKMYDTLGNDANITIPLININYLEIY